MIAFICAILETERYGSLIVLDGDDCGSAGKIRTHGLSALQASLGEKRVLLFEIYRGPASAGVIFSITFFAVVVPYPHSVGPVAELPAVAGRDGAECNAAIVTQEDTTAENRGLGLIYDVNNNLIALALHFGIERHLLHRRFVEQALDIPYIDRYGIWQISTVMLKAINSSAADFCVLLPDEFLGRSDAGPPLIGLQVFKLIVVAVRSEQTAIIGGRCVVAVFYSVLYGYDPQFLVTGAQGLYAVISADSKQDDPERTGQPGQWKAIHSFEQFVVHGA